MYVVYAGSNEVVGPYGPGAVVGTSSMSRPVIHASISVRSSRIGQLLVDSGQPRGEWRGMEMFLDKQVRADSPRMQPAYENFANNLREIVGAARASGARVLLSTVATNLRDSAPFGSLHRQALDTDGLKAWSALVQHGAELEAAQSFAEALKLYNSAAQIDDQYAELAFRIARCESALGDYAAANDHYTLARDLDTLRFRADSRINEIIRATAHFSARDTVLLDTDSLFTAESRNGVIGSELLYDHVHLTPLARYLLSRSVFEQVLKPLPQEAIIAAHSTEPPSELECERLLAFTGHDHARVAAEMADRMRRPPFTKQLNHAEQLQTLMLRAAGPPETPQDTSAQYQSAIALFPSDLTLHYKFGFFLFDYDRNAAAQQLVLARPNDELPAFLPDRTRIQ